MNERIVSTRESAEFLREMECDVIETYDFGEAGGAAHIECESEGESTITGDDRVLSVEPNITVKTHIEPEAVSEDPTTVATIEDVRRLHDVPDDDATGAGLTVVAMDSGVDTSHPVFEGVSIDQADVTDSGNGDEVGHGTAVLGQVTRLAPGADLVALRIFGSEGQTKNNVIMRAYDWLHGHTDAFDVVNMSWGSQRDSKAINHAHNALVEEGIRDVVAAGNCLPGNTWVLTGRGWRRMHNVDRMGEGTEVVSYNIDSGEFESDRIVNTFKRELGPDESLLRIHTDEGHVIEATGEHPFLLGDGYVPAAELSHGDEIYTRPDTDSTHRVPDFYDKQTNPAEEGVDYGEGKHPSGEDHIQYKERVELTCPYCGDIREAKPSVAERQTGYCDASCANLHAMEDEDNPIYDDLFKDGQTPWNKGIDWPDNGGAEALRNWRRENPELANELAENPDFIAEQAAPPSHPEFIAHQGDVSAFSPVGEFAEEWGESRTSTDIETALYDLVDELGVEYTRERPIYNNGDPEFAGGIVTYIDVAIPERQIAIYADGNYWHDYPDGTDQDRAITNHLERRGWDVIRFWGSEIKERTSHVKSQLATELVNGAVVTKIEEIDQKTVYDIQVEINSNFVANGLVVHNSGKRSGSPATAERAFSVGACTKEGTIAEFSSYNPDRDNPDVAAIGKDNRLAQASGTSMGTDLDGPWVKASGTSFSSPEVAGMVAKYLGVHDATPETVMNDFEAGARDIPNQPRDGAGLADYEAAVNE